MRALVLLLALAGCRTTNVGHAERVEHAVFVWLKEPDNEEHVARVLRATRELAGLPGVRALRMGPPLPSERPVVDSSYSVGMVFTFEDRGALELYLEHPEHERARAQVLLPLSAKVLVYDFTHDGG